MKEILYKSTRSDSVPVPASKAILMGLAEDGGLFVPTQFPELDRSLSDLADMDYCGVAYEVMKLMLTDFTEDELRNCIRKRKMSSKIASGMPTVQILMTVRSFL